jgi:hypothetical protein
MSSNFTKPEREFRVGSVRVSVWANPRYRADGTTWVTHRIAIDRGFKDQHGHAKNEDTLMVEDIPQCILALKRAYEYLTTCPGGNAGDWPSSSASPPSIERIP